MFTTILGGIFVLTAVYALAATSGLFAERSGTINLAINGGMIMGAAGYMLLSYMLVQQMGGMRWWIPIVSIANSILFSVAITTLLAIGTINFRGDHIIVGTAINILAPIISTVILVIVSHGQQLIPTLKYSMITTFPTYSKITAWEIQMIIFFIVAFIILALYLLMRKTVFGLRLRAAGENPHALAAAGVSVFKIRHLAMLISGTLSGLAGGIVVSGFLKFSAYGSSVYGMGFVALAILILGQWRMPWLILGALAFSVVYILTYSYAQKLVENQWLIYVVPYVTILISLPMLSATSNAPKAAGQPYINTGR